MKKQKGLTLIETLVVIIILVSLFFFFLYGLAAVKRNAMRSVCGSNLKGLGTAMMVYAHDYNGRYPQLPSKGSWSAELGFPYYSDPDFKEGGKQEFSVRTITASWYLLVREADVSPGSFVCPYSEQTVFGGGNPVGRELIKLWDFGYNPYAHVSYAMHNPYGRFPTQDGSSSSFAVAADMNPWFIGGHPNLPGEQSTSPQIIKLADPQTWKLGNSPHHWKENKSLYGQSVLFADGHTSYETQPNIGVKNDNIYTFWSTEENPTEQDMQGGTAPTGRTPENDAKSEEDSFLVL